MAPFASSSQPPGTLPPAQCPEVDQVDINLFLLCLGIEEQAFLPDCPPEAEPGLQCRRGGGEGRRRGRRAAGGSHSIGSCLF